jgi:hypothetical protein
MLGGFALVFRVTGPAAEDEHRMTGRPAAPHQPRRAQA